MGGRGGLIEQRLLTSLFSGGSWTSVWVSLCIIVSMVRTTEENIHTQYMLHISVDDFVK